MKVNEEDITHAPQGYNNSLWLAGSFGGSTSFCPVSPLKDLEARGRASY